MKNLVKAQKKKVKLKLGISVTLKKDSVKHTQL